MTDTGTDDDRRDIGMILADEAAGWNAGDAAAFAAHVTDDVAFTNVVGLFTVGREAFLAQHVRIFATIYKGTTLSQSIEHIAFVRPDVAIVDTRTTVSGAHALPPGIPTPKGAPRSRLQQVMVRNDGRWQVAAFHNVFENEVALAAMRPPAP